jgi:hypothetical protein
MNTKIVKMSTGWVDVSIALTHEEIDRLRQNLLELQSGKLEHFHIWRTDFDTEEPGIMDIEFTIMGKDERHNMGV